VRRRIHHSSEEASRWACDAEGWPTPKYHRHGACNGAVYDRQAAEEDLCGRANAIGKIILDRCNEIKSRSNLNCVGDVRGLGAMCAIELVKDVASGEPAPQLTQTLMKVANDNGLILLSCGTYGNVIRFLVPLTASDQIVRDGMDIFETSLTEAVTRVA